MSINIETLKNDLSGIDNHIKRIYDDYRNKKNGFNITNTNAFKSCKLLEENLPMVSQKCMSQV